MDQLLTEDDVSRVTGRAVSTLQKDRCVGGGIPFIRVGRLVRYRASDLETYLASLPAHSSTTEADEAKRSREAAGELGLLSKTRRVSGAEVAENAAQVKNGDHAMAPVGRL
jgi:hypothetical protein